MRTGSCTGFTGSFLIFLSLVLVKFFHTFTHTLSMAKPIKSATMPDVRTNQVGMKIIGALQPMPMRLAGIGPGCYLCTDRHNFTVD